MLAYSVIAAQESRYIERAIISTDSQDYADLAISYGVEAPFLRPDEISGDRSTDLEVFHHFLHWLQNNGYDPPELIVHLRPTHPIREPEDIDAMIEIMLANPEYDSIRSVAPAREIPYKMWLFQNDEKTIRPLVTCAVEEAYNAPRQILPKVYLQNACIDVVRTDTILKKNSMTGNVIAGYPMHYDFDIDTEQDFLRAEIFLAARDKIKSGTALRIVCDIDGVIAEKTISNNYSESSPIESNIEVLRLLHQQGHNIVLHTARGSATGLHWEELTRRQMMDWGVPFDELLFGKPNADVYIDDKLADLDFLRKLACN